VLAPAKPFRAEEEAKFQRHVEPWKAVGAIERDSRKVVDAEATFTDDFEKLDQANLAAIILFACNAGEKSTVMHREDQSIEQLFVAAIKRDVDKYAVSGRWHDDQSAGAPILLNPRWRFLCAIALASGGLLRTSRLLCGRRPLSHAEVSEVAFNK